MTSRLDRILSLLETGSTPLTRKAAALQLGEVQRLHPHELKNLLVKVRPYLRSTSWDTRIAASQAVEAIVSNVPLWMPQNECIKKEEDDKIGTLPSSAPSTTCGRMTFSKYKVQTVIKCGHNLLASEGKEFDDAAAGSLMDVSSGQGDSLDERDMLARQRALLNKRLGLVNAEIFGMDLDEIYTNQDLAPTSSEGDPQSMSSSSNQAKPFNKTKLDEVLMQASGGETSLKRVQSDESVRNGKLETAEPTKKIKTEVENSDSQESLIANTPNAAKEWPFEWFAEELMSDLFAPQWETRHGAATALRELIKLQGQCAGKLWNAQYISEADHQNQLWLEDLSLRLLSVLALDRFGDFLTDQVVAPVRETCAQVLGLVLKLLHTDGVHQVLNILLQLLECSEWEARHGGMLGLKYLLAVRKDMIDSLLGKVFDPIFRGLKDSVDDVSAVAAAALVPIKNALMRVMPDKVPFVIAFLWEALLDLDDLSSSTGDLLMLLSSLLTFKGLEKDNEPQSSDSTFHLLAYNDSELSELIPRLWPFLFHSLTSVRKSVLESMLILCDKSTDAWLTPPLLGSALRLIYQRTLIETKGNILDLLTQVWQRLIAKAKYSVLIESTVNHVTGWFALAMHPSKLAIDTRDNGVWLDVNSLMHQVRQSELYDSWIDFSVFVSLNLVTSNIKRKIPMVPVRFPSSNTSLVATNRSASRTRKGRSVLCVHATSVPS